MTEKYIKYLEILSEKLQKYFEQQAPYIFCKEGCSICCETGVYPFSKVEFEYAMKGFEALDEELKDKILEKVKRIKTERGDAPGKEFMYECPFLTDKKCSIYNHRAIICRSYGLLYFVDKADGSQEYKMPCCISEGLNYSNVYDAQKKVISGEKYAKSGFSQEPLSYNVSLAFLLENEITKELSLDFGEQKALIDWFE